MTLFDTPVVHHVVVVRVGVGGALPVPHLLGLVKDLCKIYFQ